MSDEQSFLDEIPREADDTGPSGQPPGVPRAKFQKVISQRQKLKAERAALQAQIQERDQQLRDFESQLEAAQGPPGPDGQPLTAVAIEQAKKALLSAAAGAVGGSGEHVAQLLSDRTVAEVADDGRIVLSFVGENGLPMLRSDGEPLRDPQEFCRDFLSSPGNFNLIRPDAQPGYRVAAERAKRLQFLRENPPRSVNELRKLPADIRSDVIDNMTPEQRKALASPARRHGFLVRENEVANEV